jgi:uncharacterized membrane protein YfcA
MFGLDLSALMLMCAALALGATVKGATGMGLPLVALPVLTAVFGLQHAVGLMAVPILLTNVMQVWRFRGIARAPELGFLTRMLVLGMIGVVIGTVALTMVPERWLVLALGVILLAYVALKLFNPHLTVSTAQAHQVAAVPGFFAGVLQGATGISAPIGVTFIHAMGLARDAHVFAVSAMFLVFEMVHVPALFAMGVMQAEWLLHGALALIPILLFMPLGQFLAGKLSRRAFDRMILLFLGLMGLKMSLGL